ncbi:IclR family transcriptional regulator [uncultured Alsobacter sp.]|uniref:IclR family transcriptional regulator n=1 Tax=uncultured Alsobacter sp. TaxID=1748258 RepID=UPI0025EF4110|nr:IclR family transcriptional regulator C-terminal domain-containing protein [uncultured Alsobacter sp.]
MVESGGQPASGEERTSGAQAIGRAAGLLRLIAAQAATGTTLTDLVSSSGLMKPTCRRILLALIDAGLAEQDPVSRRYFLGAEAHALGVAAATRHAGDPLAHEAVIRLARLTGDAAFLQVRRGYTVECLIREDGDFPLRSHVLAAGDRHALGAGAGPLALLAALSDAEVEKALDVNRVLMEQRYPTLSPALLRELVAETRRRGYSLNRGVLFQGSWGMGMAVRDATGQAVFCLSIAAVEIRMQPDREPQLATWLAEEVARLEAVLAGPRLRPAHSASPSQSRVLERT